MRNCRIFSQASSHWICPPAVRVAPFNHFFWGLEGLRNLRSLNVASVRLKMSVKFRIMQFRPCSFHGPFFLHVCARSEKKHGVYEWSQIGMKGWGVAWNRWVIQGQSRAFSSDGQVASVRNDFSVLSGSTEGKPLHGDYLIKIWLVLI